jgi:kinase
VRFLLIQYLNIGGNRFSGTLPSELSNLRQLRDLLISWNTVGVDYRNRDLRGTIPVEYFSTIVPNPNGRHLRSLQSNVDGASVARNGTASANLTSSGRRTEPAFPHLVNFSLSGTKITGSVPPPEIALATNLAVIRMGANRLMAPASLPTELGLLTNLFELDLAEVNLVSTIPSEFGNLVSLQKLKLQNNDLTGFLPSELSSLTSLSWFQVDGNVGLTGSVPSNICTLHQPTYLGCPETSLCGCDDCPACV